MSLYETALKLAIAAHTGQTRKHDGSAYVGHPIMVARLVEEAGGDEVTVAAALTHDVLEDTAVTATELEAALGPAVLEIVQAVSEDKTLDWEERKKVYVQTVLAGKEAAWLVSVADKIHNARDFISFYDVAGPSAWQVFKRGKEQKIWFERLLYTQLSGVFTHPLLEVYAEHIAILEGLTD